MDGNVVIDLVDDFDQHCIVFPGVKSGSRELAINGDNRFAWTQSISLFRHHLHPLLPKLAHHMKKTNIERAFGWNELTD